ncbi:MAG: hypothetical protein P1V51_10680 [Deltaproteobacteria bacterium]|nr:hypothetical protein [Deltaproteobacteria bacterium]
MRSKSCIASIGCALLLTAPAAGWAGEDEAREAKEPPRRGLPLEVERGGRLPEVPRPPPPRPEPEREAIEALELDLGPIPRMVVLGEDDPSATWKQAAAIPGVVLALHLPRGNMIRPALLNRLRAHPAVHLWLEMPLLPVHVKQLEGLRGLRGITLGVDPGEDEAARVGLGRLPPTRVRVWLRGATSPERLRGWGSRPRDQLLVQQAPEGLSPEALALLVARGEAGAALWIGERGAAPARLPAIDPLGVLLDLREAGGRPVALWPQERAYVDLLLGSGLQAATLRGLKRQPDGLRLTLWLSGARRKEARRALELLETTLGDRKPR